MEGDAARRYRDKAVEDLDRGARGGDHQAARRNIIIPYRNIAEAVQLPALGRRDAAASCQKQRGYPQIGRASCRERVCQYSVAIGGRRIIKKTNRLLPYDIKD